MGEHRDGTSLCSPAPNHLTEHARKIDAIFGASDTNTTQGGNQAGLKLA